MSLLPSGLKAHFQVDFMMWLLLADLLPLEAYSFRIRSHYLCLSAWEASSVSHIESMVRSAIKCVHSTKNNTNCYFCLNLVLFSYCSTSNTSPCFRSVNIIHVRHTYIQFKHADHCIYCISNKNKNQKETPALLYSFIFNSFTDSVR